MSTTTLSTLIDASARSAGFPIHATPAWSATRDGDVVTVWHYDTAMLDFLTVARVAIPRSRGWESVTDKLGVRKVLIGAGCRNASTYAELHDAGWADRIGQAFTPDRLEAQVIGALVRDRAATDGAVTSEWLFSEALSLAEAVAA
jgi:hypothetical protein